MSEKTEFYRIKSNGHPFGAMYWGERGTDGHYLATDAAGALKFASLSAIIEYVRAGKGEIASFFTPYVVEHVTVEPGAVVLVGEAAQNDGFVVRTPLLGLQDSYLRRDNLGADTWELSLATIFGTRGAPTSCQASNRPFRIFPVRSEPREVVREVK